MELRHLRYFVAVAENMHFGHAAQRLHIVQPALSKQIAALERELGVELFTRTKHRIEFTPAGRAFFAEARDILQRADHAANTAKMTASGAIGSLDIGFIGQAMFSFLPPVLREYRRRYPGVRFVLQEMPSAIQTAEIKQGRLDVGFVRPSGHDELIRFITVSREAYIVGLAEDHPLAAKDVVDLADCAEETFVLVSRTAAPISFDQELAVCQSYGFTPQVIEEGSTPAARFGMVSAGVGVTIVPESSIRVPWQGVVFRPLTKRDVEVELAFAYRATNESAALLSFKETLEELLPDTAPQFPPPLTGSRRLTYRGFRADNAQLSTARPESIGHADKRHLQSPAGWHWLAEDTAIASEQHQAERSRRSRPTWSNGQVPRYEPSERVDSSGPIKPPTDGHEDVTVLIVGGGPCGLTTALLLERAGIDFLLLERRDFKAHFPRAHLLNVRTMEIFHDLGVADDIYARSPPEDRWHRVAWYTSLGGADVGRRHKIGELYAWGGGPDRVRYSQASPRPFANLPQVRLDTLLWQHADARSPGRLRARQEVVDLAPDADGVTVTVDRS